jgi:rhodanese-related sulfurtransferase
MKNILALLIAAFVLVGCASAEGEEGAATSTTDAMNKQERVSKETFKSFLSENKGNVQLIDVRTPDEYAAGTIEGAKNMDFYGENFQADLESLDKEQPVMIFCKSGGRSGQTLEMMKEMGFSTVLELEGGYSGWE